ncbi:MAG TPA: hypothetical protein VG755_16930 [Nannocystaceae bacterium]|nr:hypothetical protein [Nannocystaceae bacterium]
MARHNVSELWASAQRPGALVRVPTGQLPAVPPETTIVAWAERVPVAAPSMIIGGVAIALLGGVLAVLNPLGFLGVAIFGGMITFGGGIAWLGAAKARGGNTTTPAPVVDPRVAAERSRRVAALLGQLGQATFETLLARLRWTEQALIETLVHMTETAAVVEDLDLDSGEWVYRMQHGHDFGTRGSMALDERRERA